MITSTIVWASHFTITGIKVTTLAEGKAMCGVWTQKLFIFGFNQRNKCLLPGVDQTTVDGLDVFDNGIVLQCTARIDRFEPDHFAITFDWVTSQIEIGKVSHIGT